MMMMTGACEEELLTWNKMKDAEEMVINVDKAPSFEVIKLYTYDDGYNLLNF